MHCSTIIVSYNTFDLTREAIQTALVAAEGLTHEVIVVDNDSPDESAVRLQACFPEETFPHVHILANTENAGFSRANNRGAARARGAVLFFLNPDTLVHGQAVGLLYDFLQRHPEAGAVGPRVLNADGTDQPSTLDFITARWILRHHLPLGSFLGGHDRRLDPIPERTGPVDVVKGCALALRREVFDEIGGWDESYFMYSEETELCYTLKHRGYTNYYLRDAEITHYGGVSSQDYYAEQQVVALRSLARFLRRHHSPFLVGLHRVTGIFGYGLRALFFPALARRRPDRALEYRQRGEAASNAFRWFLLDYS